MAENKVKEHFKKYGKLYLGVGIGVVVGGLVFNKEIVITIIKNKGNNNINTVTTNLARRGHPGNIVKCLETGEVFASQNRAAEALGLSKSAVSDQLRGIINDAKGYTFETLGEAQ